jgi:addiction module HigA family antidote
MMNNPNAITNPAEQAVTPGAHEHPGGWIKRNVLEPFGLTIAETARRIDVNRANLHNVLAGQHAVSRDLAYRLEALTGVSADLMIGLQSAYDTDQDREKRERYAREIERAERPKAA